ncbi:MoaF-related domain-containing protein [Peredibacter starrii]|uniref:MoaF-like domain-containing protein n=1 Tax=Peredibacter starrii TaxID=28202 RepID=A0AAX4HTR7_9BACT|nr:hypothetical protein [Peredibacter starrii]WPU66790.1 hypothetical protein SOO65_08520 [Peredibacter starrii]
MESFPVHAVYELEFPEFTAEISVLSSTHLQFEIKEGRYERTAIVNYEAQKIRSGVFIVSWQDEDKSTVVHVEDFINRKIFTFATLDDNTFIRSQGNIRFIEELNEGAYH